MKKKSFFYFHLKNISTIIWLSVFFILFIYCHYFVLVFNWEGTLKGKIIESLADGMLLAICMGLISIIINNYKARKELENRKEGIENVLKLSIIKLVYTDSPPALEKISLPSLCETAITSINKYKQDKFEQFRYAVNNDLPVIEQNINEATKIDLTNSLAYNVLVSNLTALINEWNNIEKRIKQYDKDYLINYSQNIYNIFFQAKFHLIIYLKSCQNFSNCNYEDYAWSMVSEEDKKLAPQGKDEDNFNSTQYKSYDASLYEYKSLAKNMQMGHNNYIEILEKETTDKCSDYCFLNYDDFWNLKGIGFSARFLINQSMEYISIVLCEKNSKNFIEFMFHRNGSISVLNNETSLFTENKKKSHLVLNRFNKVSVKAIDDGTLKLFINGFLIFSFEKPNIPIVLSNDNPICIGYERKKTEKNYHALIKINTIQKLK